MEPESIPYTAFRCDDRLWEFTVMPFGLSNAPATFQRAMETLFRDMRPHLLVYLDDILIHHETAAGALALLRRVLTRLAAAGLTLNLPKCDIFPAQFLYLGHLVSAGELRPNPKRVAALQHIKIPTNVSELRSLLGHFNYYQSYVNHYTELILPVQQLMNGLPKRALAKKSRWPIEWAPECTRAVQAVRNALQAAVLAIPREPEGKDTELLMETDASDHTIAAVLHFSEGTGWKPLEYMSKKLGEAQLRWPTCEKEAFDPYIRGRKVTVHTDHANLRWMLEAKTGKLARWASRMAEYDLDIYHKSGDDLAHIDFLTRNVEPEEGLDDRMCYEGPLESGRMS